MVDADPEGRDPGAAKSLFLKYPKTPTQEKASSNIPDAKRVAVNIRIAG
jgi:hypothetical protein